MLSRKKTSNFFLYFISEKYNVKLSIFGSIVSLSFSLQKVAPDIIRYLTMI